VVQFDVACPKLCPQARERQALRRYTYLMKRDRALAILHEHGADLKRLGVESLTLFGSVARDEATPDSDIDLLVDFEGATSFDAYMAVKNYLEDLLACHVDLVMRKALKDRARPAIERDAVRVA
jgi:uncharacterized protein